MYPRWFKTLLFALPPEASHHTALALLKIAYTLRLTRYWLKAPSAPCVFWGKTFPNPIGLAAGLDKDGDYIDCLGSLGFGFIEIGTVTPKPQAGNPKPRMFRLMQHEAIINRLGFNSKGVDYVAERLKRRRFQGIVGANIGKNRATPLDLAEKDYVLLFERLAPWVDYVTVNISSPNTEKLRDLQHGELLYNLLRALKAAQARQSRYVPLWVKVAPDVTDDEMRAMAKLFLEHAIDGVVATNTTLSRTGVEGAPYAAEAGGLSGRPLAMRAVCAIQRWHTLLEDKIPIIGCGGTMDRASAIAKWQAGARLLQLYTGLIYRGPVLIAEACEAFASQMD